MSKNNIPSGFVWTQEDVQDMAEKIRKGSKLSKRESKEWLDEFFEEEEIEIMNFIYSKLFTFVSKKMNTESVKNVK